MTVDPVQQDVSSHKLEKASPSHQSYQLYSRKCKRASGLDRGQLMSADMQHISTGTSKLYDSCLTMF